MVTFWHFYAKGLVQNKLKYFLKCIVIKDIFLILHKRVFHLMFKPPGILDFKIS